MNLKIRFTIWFTVFVAIIILAACFFVYYNASEYRKDEFYLRLRQKALTTHRLLVNVKEVDTTLLKIIDKNNLNALTDQTIIIFDENFKPLYCNRDLFNFQDNWLFERIKNEKEVKIEDKDQRQILGIWLDEDNSRNAIYASAYDTFGRKQLRYLRNVLIITWILSLMLTIGLAYLYVQRIISKPLMKLTQKIAAIDEDDLTMRLNISHNEGELTTLSESFNAMLERLEKSFESQRYFVQYASHELRTPIANMLAETENALSSEHNASNYKSTLTSMQEDLGHLAELTNSLLLISRYEKVQLSPETPLERIDEILFSTIDEIKSIYPKYHIEVNFKTILTDEKHLLLRGNSILLKSAFRNLIENACKYSENTSVNVIIDASDKHLIVNFDNLGAAINIDDVKYIFTPFVRGNNTGGKKGFGLGLAIAKRILKVHNGDIQYERIMNTVNRFKVIFENTEG